MSRVFAYIGCLAVFAGAALGQAFTGVEIRASAPNTAPRMRIGFDGGRYIIRNATLVDLIRTAWGVDADNVDGGPEWMDTSRFDLVATAPASTTPEALKTMLQALLKDRFQLRAHTGSKDLAGYALTAGKKVQLKQSDGAGPSGCSIATGKTARDPVLLTCRNISMAAFAADIPGRWPANEYVFTYRVLDRTGLTGAWDFRVTYSHRAAVPGAGAVSLFDAFEQQLGLKLEPAKVDTPVVVVDSVREPQVEKASTRRLAFEVADIRPDAPGLIISNVGIQPGGRVNIQMTLQGLIWEAWGNLNPDRFIGGPKNMNDIGWVVIAKAPVEQGPVSGWNGVDVDTMRQMLRSLLEDRFKLVAHEEQRDVDGYALVATKPKLKKAAGSDRPGCREGPGSESADRNWKDPRLTNPAASRLVTCRNVTLAELAAALSKPTAEENPILLDFPPIVDATGLSGRYDLSINFSPPPIVLGRIDWKGGSQRGANVGTAGGEATEPDGSISIFEALEKQLGLKLESRKVPGSVLVIDHVEDRPTAN